MSVVSRFPRNNRFGTRLAAASLLDDSFPAGRPEDLNEAVGLRDDVARRWAGKYLGRDPEEAALDFAAETLRPGGLVFRPRRCRQLFDLVSDAFGFDELRSAVSEVLSELRDDEYWEPSEAMDIWLETFAFAEADKEGTLPGLGRFYTYDLSARVSFLESPMRALLPSRPVAATAASVLRLWRSLTSEAAARAVTTTPSANTLAGFRRLGPLAWGEQWEAVEAGDVPVDVYVPSPAEAEVWVCDGAPDVDYDWFSSCVPDEFSDGFASRPLWIVDGQAASRVLHRTDVDLSSALVGAVADAWLPSLDDVDAVLSLWARTSSVQAGRFSQPLLALLFSEGGAGLRFSQPLLALLFREGGADLVWERVPFDLLVDVVPDWVTAQVLSRFSDPDLVWNLVGDGWSGTGAQLEAAAAA